MKADVLNIKGEVVGNVELDNNIFGIEPNEPVVHQFVRSVFSESTTRDTIR